MHADHRVRLDGNKFRDCNNRVRSSSERTWTVAIRLGSNSWVLYTVLVLADFADA